MYNTPIAHQHNYNILRGSADLVEEVNNLVTYLGFCKPGTTSEAAAEWSILKISQSSTVQPILTSFTWAEGRASFDLIWNNRAAYTYKFKNF